MGSSGSNRRRRCQSAYATGAMAIGVPGCPELACWTASIASVRMVLILRVSTSRVVGMEDEFRCGEQRSVYFAFDVIESAFFGVARLTGGGVGQPPLFRRTSVMPALRAQAPAWVSSPARLTSWQAVCAHASQRINGVSCYIALGQDGGMEL